MLAKSLLGNSQDAEKNARTRLALNDIRKKKNMIGMTQTHFAQLCVTDNTEQELVHTVRELESEMLQWDSRTDTTHMCFLKITVLYERIYHSK